MSDYLAIVLIGGGSSWGRSPDKEKAVKNCLVSLRDWDSLFVMEEKDIPIQVWDVDGYSKCYWDHQGMHAVNEKTGEQEDLAWKEKGETVTARFIPRKKKRA